MSGLFWGVGRHYDTIADVLSDWDGVTDAVLTDQLMWTASKYWYLCDQLLAGGSIMLEALLKYAVLAIFLGAFLPAEFLSVDVGTWQLAPSSAAVLVHPPAYLYGLVRALTNVNAAEARMNSINQC